MFCPICGRPNVDGMFFCPDCGTRLQQPNSTQNPASSPNQQGSPRQGQNPDPYRDLQQSQIRYQQQGYYQCQGQNQGQYQNQNPYQGQNQYQEQNRYQNQYQYQNPGQNQYQGAHQQQNQYRAPYQSAPPPPPEEPGGDPLLIATRVVAFVMAAFFLIRAVMTLPGIPRALRLILSFRFNYAAFGVLYLINYILAILSLVLMAAVLALYGLRLNLRKRNAEPLLLTVASGAVFRIVVLLLDVLLMQIARAFYNVNVFTVQSVLVAVILPLLAFGILFLLDMLLEGIPFSNLSGDALMDAIRQLPVYLQNELNDMASEFRRRRAERSGGTGAGGAYSAGTSCDYNTGTAYGPGTAASNGPRPMKENRSLVMYYLVGIITCSIYALYVLYTFARDVNIMCAEDGKHTAGLIKLIVFSLITCGIYTWVWYYKLLTRVQETCDRHGIQVKTFGGMELGPCYLVISILGRLISVCGIGLVLVIYADYLVFTNLNNLSKAYNASAGTPYDLYV